MALRLPGVDSPELSKPFPPPLADREVADWSLSDDDEPANEPANEPVEAQKCFELRGSAYIAFCKPWGPLFVAPEEEEDAWA